MISFINKKRSNISNPLFNIFMQTAEPEKKEGIWIKKNDNYDKVIIDNNALTEPVLLTPVKPNTYINASYPTGIILNGELYVGNFDNSNTKRFIKISDISTTSFIELNNTMFDLNSGTIGIYENSIYFYTVNNSENLYKYNKETDTWETINGITATVSTGGTHSCMINDKMYISNGFNLYELDLTNKTYKALPNLSIDSLTIISDGINIYALPRYYLSNTNKYLAKYNVETHTCESFAEIPDYLYETALAGGVYKNGKIYIFTFEGKMAWFDLNSSTWSAESEIITLENAFSSSDSKIFLDYEDKIVTMNKSGYIQAIQFPTKEYDTNSIVIHQGIKYYTQLMNTPVGTEGRLLNNFIDVWHSTESGLDKTTGLAYGNGTEWVDIR